MPHRIFANGFLAALGVICCGTLSACSSTPTDSDSGSTGGALNGTGAGAPGLEGGAAGASNGGPPAAGGTSAASGGVTSPGASGGVTSTGGGAGAMSTGGGGSPSSGDGGTSNDAGSGGSNDGCGIPPLDASRPPATLALTGNLGTHDPAAIFADGVYYLFATGNGISTKISQNLLAWTGTPDVFSAIPGWVSGKLSGVTNIWAPDVSYFGGSYHLYYAVSTFGSKKSCIGHATRTSLASGSWTDHGVVVCSNVGTSDDFNAIDPNVVVDESGTPWLDFGSFWSGIKMVKLEATGARSDTEIHALAHNSSIEGPFIVHQCGYYYLFVSFGACCGDPYDYNIRVGRSKSVTGPYLDKTGKDMMNGGGTLLVQGNSTWTAPGHNALLVTAGGAYSIYHALNSNHANPTLRIAELRLDADGWPVSGGP
jgi:arabinan endo-1,5-alpha-L-arabinosidase